MRITVFECPHCKSLHRSEAKMKKCRDACKAKKKKAIERKKIEKEYNNLMHYPRLNATSIPHLIQLCKEIAKKVWDVELDFTLDIRYSNQVSNTHSAPVGDVRNWHGEADKPCGYAGFHGRIRGTCQGKTDISGSNFFNGAQNFEKGIVGINTGSGGGGRFSYDVSLFLDDFPLIKKNREIYEQKETEIQECIYNIEKEVGIKIHQDPKVIEWAEHAGRLNVAIQQIEEKLHSVEYKSREYVQKTYRDEASRLQEKARQELAQLEQELGYVRGIDKVLTSGNNYDTILS